MAAGGKREGAGRKPKAQEEKAQDLIKRALRELYRKDSDDENTVQFLKSFAETQKGQQFIAEHLLGKPKENLNLSGGVSINPIEWVE